MKPHGNFMPEREFICVNGHEGHMVPRVGRKSGYRCAECARLSGERQRRKRGVTKHGSHEHFRKLSARPNRPVGERHHAWKGDDVGYFGCHEWLRKQYPLTGICELCGGPSREYAYKGKPGEWERNRDAYYEACHSCNRRLDHKLRKLYAATGQ